MDECRKQFEEWVRANGGDVTTAGNGHYITSITELWWSCWRAAWQAAWNHRAEAVATVNHSRRNSIDWHIDYEELPTDTPLFTFPPAAQVPEGYKLVPIDPTSEMLAALSGEWHSSRHRPDRYKAMLASAPEVKHAE